MMRFIGGLSPLATLLCLLLLLAGCVNDNGHTEFLFKHRGVVTTAAGEMELAQGLGLPFALGNITNSLDFSKPTIFLPRALTDAHLLGVSWIGSSSIVVIQGRTDRCQYDYVLISIDRARRYFAREIAPCDHPLSFASNTQGLTAVDQSGGTPRYWWMSDRSFTGPIMGTSLASVSPQQPISRRPDRGSAAAVVAKPQQISSAAPMETPPDDVAVAPSVTRRLALEGQPALKFDLPTAGASGPRQTNICLTDSCAQ